MDNDLVYDRELEKDFQKLSLEHKSTLNLIPSDSKVLEVGCHTGYFSYWLKQKGCSVIGVDIYEPCGIKASLHLDCFIAGNIEDKETLKKIHNQGRYDVILLMHVLEHLIEPERVLSELKEFLVSDGSIIICLPNISNWNSRINILRGNFEYTESGLMDKTHLRFFNYYTSHKLINNSGLTTFNYIGTGKVYFKLIPNWRFVWRLNNYLNQLILKVLSKKHNVIDTLMLFYVKLK